MKCISTPFLLIFHLEGPKYAVIKDLLRKIILITCFDTFFKQLKHTESIHILMRKTNTQEKNNYFPFVITNHFSLT